MTSSARSAPSASSISAGSRPCSSPRTRMRLRPSPNPSSSDCAATRAPSGLCAASMTTSGLRRMTSNRPGTSTAANASARNLVGDRRVEERLDGRDARSPRCRPGARRATRRRPRRSTCTCGADVDDASADREPVGDAVEVTTALDVRDRIRRQEHLAQLGRGLAEHQRGVGLDDAGLLLGDRAAPVTGAVGVVTADVGDDRDLRIDDVGRVPPTEQPDLDHRDVDRRLREPVQRGGREDLEVRQRARRASVRAAPPRRSPRRSRRR